MAQRNEAERLKYDPANPDHYMKPTPELMKQWLYEAQTNTTRPSWMQYVAELAAQWGEQQSLDGKRLEFIERKLFVHSWNGVIDSGSQTNWRIAGDYRHTTAKMLGNDFRAAIDNAMKGEQQ